MESKTDAFTLNEALVRAIQAGSNCILIGERHDICPGLLPLASVLLRNQDFFSQYNICIFSENYPALGEDHLKPFDIDDLNKYETNHRLRPLLIDLIKNQINIFGLETPLTNPFHQFSYDNVPWDIKSLPLIRKIAENFQLIDTFESTYQCTIEEFCNENDFVTTLKVVMDIYAISTNRLSVPNQEFSSLIHRMPKNTVCITIVGNTHIPRVRTKDSHEPIDDGMENRLKNQPRTQEILSTTISYGQPQPNETYTIMEPYCEYDPISMVLQVEDSDLLYYYFEKNKSPQEMEPPLLSAQSNSMGQFAQRAPAPLRMIEDEDEPDLNSEAFQEIDLSPEQENCCSSCRFC